MTGEGDETRGRVVGRPWFLIGLALAVAATIPLVLADDVRYMRLGIVAALWAALIGAFLAVRYRRQATSTEEVVAQAQEVYELELEREIAARREFELEVEAETRQRVESESRSELDALRAEIASLRENLQGLFGGEVLLERVALTAQATRMRALREEQKFVESGTSKPAQLTAAKKEATDRRPSSSSGCGRRSRCAPASAPPPPNRVARNGPWTCRCAGSPTPSPPIRSGHGSSPPRRSRNARRPVPSNRAAPRPAVPSASARRPRSRP